MMLALLALVTLTTAPRDVEVAAKGERLDLVFRAGAFDTMHAQLLCLAHAFQCSDDATRALWHDSMNWSAEDDVALKEWTALLEKYEAVLEERGEATAPFPDSAPPRWSLNDKVKRAFLSARNESELTAALGVLVTAGDVDGFLVPLHRFFPRFLTWWTKEGLALSSNFAADCARVSRSAHLAKIAEQVMAFYAPPLSGRQVITLHLVPRFRQPSETGSHTSATVVEREAYVEFVPGEKPEQRLDVVLHEVFHFFYASRSEQQQRELINAFAAINSDDAVAIHAVLDEGLATAFGNGLVEETLIPSASFAATLEKTQSFYAEPTIDAVGKAWFARAHEWLQTKETLSPALTASLVSSASSRLADTRGTLAFLLKVRALEIVNEEDMSLQQQLKRGFRSISSFTDSGHEKWTLDAFPKMSGVIAVRSADLSLLKAHMKTIDAEVFTQLNSRREGVFAFKRAPGAEVYVVLSADHAGLENQLRLMLMSKNRFIGWLPSNADAGIRVNTR